MNGVTADGGTNHLSALLAAIRLRPDVIFLLTDGEEKDDLNAEQLDRIDRQNGGGASINVIQFGMPPDREARWRCLPNRTAAKACSSILPNSATTPQRATPRHFRFPRLEQ